MFGAFILSCGFGHLMEVVTTYTPLYRLSGLVKLLTALASWATVVGLMPVIPKALALRTPEELEREVKDRIKAESSLVQMHAQLAQANARLKQEAAERERLVEELRRNESMFQGLFHFAPNGIIVTGTDGNIQQANQQAEKLFGYGRDELVGQPVELLIPERFHESHRRHREQFTGRPRTRPMGEGRELFARRKDGSEFPVDVTLAPLQRADETLVVSNVRDISHRKVNEDIIKARSRQQAALAEFAQRALWSTDLHPLLNQGVAAVAQTLNVDLCRVAELLPGGEKLVLRAGWGWNPDHVGRVLFDSGKGSQDGYCLTSGQALVVADMGSETRFTPSPYLREHGAVSGVSVPIKGRASPHGVLGINTTRAREFTTEDVVFLRLVADMLAATFDRYQAEQQLQASLTEKGVLLKEVHHRVKNNLQVVTSLLYLQSQQTHDSESVEMFRESQHRVRSMALIHERLYRSRDLAHVDLTDYIEDLAHYLFRSYQVDATRIRLEVEAREVELSVDAAVPCGLLVNELISNCLKHAFKEEGGMNGTVGRIRHAAAELRRTARGYKGVSE